MLYYKNGWHLCAEKVRYIQHGEEIEQSVGGEGHDWWVEFEQKWEYTEIQEFILVGPTEEQVARLEEVNQLKVPDGFAGIVGDYVKDGSFPAGYNHPLRLLQLKKEQQLQDNYLLDLDFRQAMSELGV